jgi:glycolate oxidase iron-sulfur subunit
MQTSLSESFKNTPEGHEANKILRSCVHCGFCITHCPTYRLLGNELDSPRGRIYLIKGLLEGKEVSQKTQLHLDRCLTCLSCETHCPSGVEYGHLLDIGRQAIEKQIDRTFPDKLFRTLLRKILPYQMRFAFLLGIGRMLRPILPHFIKIQIPTKNKNIFPLSPHQFSRKMILVNGCVQPSLTPTTNDATRYVLGKLGISTITAYGENCCGALDHHMSATESAKKFIKNNIDQWWPSIENGVEAIISTASGCGVMVKDYGYILRNDDKYADKAAHISAMTKDVAEIISSEDIGNIIANIQHGPEKIAFHNPCTLQHGQKLNEMTESLLKKFGFELTDVPDKALCCGSAGTYSLLQINLSKQLLENKINALESEKPDIIATANIGCQLYIQQATDLPVKHWIELVAEKLLKGTSENAFFSR